MFKSDSVRHLSLVKNGLGPCYYKMNNDHNKKTFNLNPGKMWV